METMMVAGLILNPIGLIIFILIPTIAVLSARRPQFSARRLVAGYAGALFALFLIVAASSYVSPHDAVSVWHIPPERYWSALLGQFIALFAVAAFASVVGISCVGIPVLVALSNSGKATAPWLILASVLISACMAVLAYLIDHSSSNTTFLEALRFLVMTHGALSIGFSLAARLPWTLRYKP